MISETAGVGDDEVNPKASIAVVDEVPIERYPPLL
jgi:hypothetical protein